MVQPRGRQRAGFWDNEASYTTPNRGFIVLDKVMGITSGEKSGSIEASFKWVDPNKKPLMGQTKWSSTPSRPCARSISTLRASGHREGDFQRDSKEGTFGMRLAAGLEAPTRNSPALPKRTGVMVNSNGQEGEAELLGKTHTIG